MLNKISDIIGINRHGSALGAARIVSQAQKVVGERARVVSVKNGVLKLNVESSVSADKLNMEKEKLIQDINQQLGSSAKIDRVKFEL